MTMKCFDIPSSGFQFQNLYPPAKKKLWGEAFHNFKNGFSHNCGGNRHHLFDCLSDLSVEKIAIEGIFIIIGNAVSAMTSVSLHCPENLSTCATCVNRSVKTFKTHNIYFWNQLMHYSRSEEFSVSKFSSFSATWNINQWPRPFIVIEFPKGTKSGNSISLWIQIAFLGKIFQSSLFH